MTNVGSGNTILRKINYYWRILATGLCFLVFNIGGLFMRVVIFPLLNITLWKKPLRITVAREIIRVAFRGFVELMNLVGVISVEIHGLDKLKRNGLLILSNHPTLIDTVFLMAFVKNADCIVKSALWRNPFTYGPVRAAGYICNDNASGLIADCIKSLQNGSNLTIFPEGTRTGRDGVITFKRGAANIALRAKKNITPVVIRCSPSTLTKGEKWWEIPPTKAHFTINAQEDIDIQAFTSARQLTHYLQDYFMKDIHAVEQLETEVKHIIINTLQLEDITVNDIDANAALFGDGLGLDSIDALELGVALQKRYGIALSANTEETRAYFASVNALASMITRLRKN